MVFPMSQVESSFANTHKLIYGYPKTGKTTLASTMIDSKGRTPAFAATEDRHSSLVVARVRIKSWAGFVKYIDFVAANITAIKEKYSCLVLDVVSDLDAWCSSHVAQIKNVEYVGDLDMGKGWKLTRDLFQKEMDRLMAMMPITFVAHAAEKRVHLNGEALVTQAPNLSKQALEYINGKVDTIMFIVPANSKKEFPTVSMRPSVGFIAGAGQKALCREFDFRPENPGATWTEICKVYADAQKTVADSAQPVAQAAEQPK